MNQPSKPEQQVIDLAGKTNPEAFNEALTLTCKGDKIIYHRGLFAGGRYRAAASLAHDAGLVSLVQGRINKDGDTRFVYIAQRTGKKFK